MKPPLGDKVLLVDDSRAITQLLSARCEVVAGVPAETAASLAVAMARIESDPDPFFLAVVGARGAGGTDTEPNL